MTRSIPRLGITSLASAALLSLTLAGGTAAQVVTLGDPGADPEPTPAPVADELQAQEAMLESMRPDLDPEEAAERDEQRLALAECMRERDWDFADPDAGGDFGFQLRESGIDMGDPAFQEDFQACQSETGMDFGPPGGDGGVAE